VNYPFNFFLKGQFYHHLFIFLLFESHMTCSSGQHKEKTFQWMFMLLFSI